MKTIFITGATAGIGRHAALEAARQGHHVIASGRRKEQLESLAAEAAKIGKGCVDVLVLDVTDEPAVQAAAAKVMELTAGRGIDVLVNNAGYGQMGPLEEVSDAELRKQYDTNVFGLMNVTRAFVPQLRVRGEGRIVNVGSIGGKLTFPLMGAYNSTKYAVEALSDALRNELAPFGIAVSLIEPGPIRTEFNDRAKASIGETHRASPYASALARADAISAKFESQSAGPEVTTAAILHAAVGRRPRARYVVPFSMRLVLPIVLSLPTLIVDAVMRAMAGLTRRSLAAHAATADGARALGR